MATADATVVYAPSSINRSMPQCAHGRPVCSLARPIRAHAFLARTHARPMRVRPMRTYRVRTSAALLIPCFDPRGIISLQPFRSRFIRNAHAHQNVPPARSSPPSLRQTPPRWAGDKPRPRSPPRPRLPRPTPARARCPMRADRPHEKSRDRGWRRVDAGQKDRYASSPSASPVASKRAVSAAVDSITERVYSRQTGCSMSKSRSRNAGINIAASTVAWASSPISALSTGICR